MAFSARGDQGRLARTWSSSDDKDLHARHATDPWFGFKRQHWRLARLEHVLPLVGLRPVDVAVVLATLAAQVLNVDGLKGSLGLRPIFSLKLKRNL